MNLYVKINSIKYPIISYSYRLNNVDNNTKISHLFSCVVVSEAIISANDTIEFYSDDVLIYSDPINSVIVNGSRISIESEKVINVPTSKTNTIDIIIFYSTNKIRTSLNLDVIPLDDLETSVGNFTAGKVTNYSFYSEIEIG